MGPTLMAMSGGIRAGLIGGGFTVGLNPVGKLVGGRTAGGAVLVGDVGFLIGDVLLDRDLLLNLSSLDFLFRSRDEDRR